jgi:hypothetical protein
MLERLINAVNGSRAFERFVILRSPVDQFRNNLQTRFKIESERGLVLKDDFNDVVMG